MSDDQQERTWPHVVKLKHPVEFGSETVTELTFRRGRFGDIKGLKVDEIPTADQLMQVAARMCGRQLKVIESLDGDDVSEVLEVALGFFTNCLQGGKTP